MMEEKRRHSLAKAITYRVVSSVITGSTFFAFTQKASLSIGVAIFDSIVKTGVFYFHERAWVLLSAFSRSRLKLEEEPAEAA